MGLKENRIKHIDGLKETWHKIYIRRGCWYKKYHGLGAWWNENINGLEGKCYKKIDDLEGTWRKIC